ncbi:unnamed protein product [Spirodela intermedia]|uniref:Malectin-like domain-containing protein n=1 Tax=Spirodela intermedia TaxID=51605 RepID=A0A7I8J9Q5_SPIIN|nr:unnamed protein product [Spirodela intermedia]CAA6666956.1 unnamed protein product [Spirodela intermedia]
MGNLQICGCLLLFLAAAVLRSSAIVFAPADKYLLDCGAASPTTLDDRRVFLPDDCSSTSTSSFALLSSQDSTPVEDPNPSTPPDRGAAHLVRLHFRSFSSPSHNLSAARFHVVAGRFVLLSNFSLVSVDGGPLLKEYIFTVESDYLVITFAPADASSLAFVNAIEVFSGPTDLISDLAWSEADNDYKNWGLSGQALETLYRINVGGAKVTSFNDTLWRTWKADDADFLKSGISTSRTVAFSGRVNYREGGASREVAPDHVYATSRVTDSNLTWVFHLNPGYKYLARMHFCDIVSLALNQLYFDIMINGKVVYDNFDLSKATDQSLASPFYIDFVVRLDNTRFLTVGISSSRLGFPANNLGLLNGLEIFKINNTVGSLDGTVKFFMFLRSLLCGFTFISLIAVAFMLVQWLRTETRSPVAWLPLPVDAEERKLMREIPITSGKTVQ